MVYSLEIAENLNKVFKKLAKKDKTTFEAINKKINVIRVHISGSFVLIFKIDEERKLLRLLEFEHHDNVYK